MTNDVTLRAVGQEDIPLLARWRNDPDHETAFGDFLPMARRQHQYHERFAVNGMISEDEGLLIICRAGEPVGTVSWHPVHYGPTGAASR